MTRMSFYNACLTILSSESKTANMPYAKAYAQTGLGLIGQHEIACQAAYILANLNYWRGTTAKDVKKTLKEAL